MSERSIVLRVPSAPSSADGTRSAPFAENTVLIGRGRRHRVRDFEGPLSIKSVRRGRVEWRTEGRALPVDESSFLVLDHGQPYSMEIAERRPVETCCVFFRPGFVESLGSALADEEPRGVRVRPRLHGADAGARAVLARLEALHRAVVASDGAQGGEIDARRSEAHELEEALLALARDLALLDRDGRRRLEQLASARASTREELARRVGRARDFLHASYARPLALSEIARAAHLSEYHFHRAFRRAFGVTPRAYLNDLRLERALFLLTERGLGVADTTRAVGFESPSSFTHLFRRRYGIAPSAALRARSAERGERRPVGPQLSKPRQIGPAARR